MLHSREGPFHDGRAKRATLTLQLGVASNQMSHYVRCAIMPYDSELLSTTKETGGFETLKFFVTDV